MSSRSVVASEELSKVTANFKTRGELDLVAESQRLILIGVICVGVRAPVGFK